MAHLTPIELSNWLALYTATSLCCLIALALSAATAGVRAHRERWFQEALSPRCIILLLPRTWWRWQKLYLSSTPVTLGIVVAFGMSLHWQ